MRFRTARVIEPEYLDDTPPDASAGSLRDLVRINRLAGGHRVLLEALRSCVRPHDSFTMLDVGSASGDAAELVRRNYPHARVVCLDYRMHHLKPGAGERTAADAFRMPFRPRQFDIVYCGLFLHHFANTDVVRLLATFGSISRRFVIANDLERHIVPYWFLPFTRWIFGWDPITLHDGPISVQAAFSQKELGQLAREAGLRNASVRRYRPAFRLLLVAESGTYPGDTLGR